MDFEKSMEACLQRLIKQAYHSLAITLRPSATEFSEAAYERIEQFSEALNEYERYQEVESRLNKELQILLQDPDSEWCQFVDRVLTTYRTR